MASDVALDSAKYSNSVEDRAIDCCFSLPQEITPLASKKQ